MGDVDMGVAGRYKKPHKRKRAKAPHACEDGCHVCTKCLLEKPCSEFPSDFPRTRWCYKCRADWQANWRAENREKYLEDQRKRYSPEASREYTLKTKYDLTLDKYTELCGERENRCDICGMEPHDGILRVDHNHGSGAVRGLLCDRCNRALGLFGDDPQVLRHAAAYLEANGHYGSSGTVTTIAAA